MVCDLAFSKVVWVIRVGSDRELTAQWLTYVTRCHTLTSFTPFHVLSGWTGHGLAWKLQNNYFGLTNSVWGVSCMCHCICKTIFDLSLILWWHTREERRTRPALPSPSALSLHARGFRRVVLALPQWAALSIHCRDVFPSYLNESSVSEKAKSPLWLNTWFSFLLHDGCCGLFWEPLLSSMVVAVTWCPFLSSVTQPCVSGPLPDLVLGWRRSGGANQDSWGSWLFFLRIWFLLLGCQIPVHKSTVNSILQE